MATTWEVAKRILDCKGWKLYLSPEDGKIFEMVAQSEAMWNRFMNNPAACLDRKMKFEISSAFRIRLMISEQYLSLLFPLQYTSSIIPLGKPIDHYNIIQYMNTDVKTDMEPNDNMLVPIDDHYHLLEFDAEILENPELLQSDSLNDTEQVDISLEGEDSKSTDAFKNMFTYLQQNHNIDIKEMRKIVIDAKPSKSKWANDDRVGQEQLYSALEKVLSKLKNYTDHSIPFLKPVQKREAPNYYDIIKNPMDLGTMSKKLKSFQYTSKLEFEKDLNLIWTNCLTYNTIADSIYRKHAYAMKKKSDDLLKNVPDVKITTQEDSDSEDEKGSVDINGGPKPLSKTGSLMDLAMSQISDFKDQMSEIQVKSEPMDVEIDPEVDAALKAEELKTEQENILIEKVTKDSNFSDEIVKRAIVTKKRKLLKRMVDNESKNFEDLKFWLKSESKVATFLVDHQRYIERNELRRRIVEKGYDTKKTAPEIFHSMNLPELDHHCSSIPMALIKTCKYPGDQDEFYSDEYSPQPFIPSAPLPSMSEYSALQFDFNSPLNSNFLKNVSDISHLKEVYFKILEKQNMLGPDLIQSLDVDPPIPFEPCWKEQDLPPISANNTSSMHLLKRTVAWIIFHQGFDSVCGDVLSTLTEIAHQYIKNLASTIVYNMEQGLGPPERLLTDSLAENGLDDVEQLFNYMKTDVIRYGQKIEELKKKLEIALMSLDKNGETMDDIAFENHDEHIMSGNFFEDLNIDFLNLKDLGINLTSVPLSLWNKNSEKPIKVRLKKTLLNPETTLETEPEKVLPPAEPWSPIVAEKQIGLFSKFYESLKQEPEGLIEDEFKPKTKEMKLMIKASQQSRKRTFEEPPKKKKKLDPQQKAQKDAEKAKKQAAKQERMRLKEEKKKMKANK